MSSFSMIRARVLLVLCCASGFLAGGAQAGNLVGGGSILPAIGYVGRESPPLSAPLPGSMLKALSTAYGIQSTYCLTGSGAGKAVFAGVMGANVQNPCANVPAGFGAATAGRPDLTQPSFAAAGTPISSADYANYVSNHLSGKPVQFPSIAGSIAIAFNKADATTSLNLTAAQVCAIFNGTVTRWSDLGFFSADPITVVYRKDNSGTTFALANFLAATCPGTALQHDRALESFEQATSLFFPSGLPSNWIGATGHADAIHAIQQTDGAIGYVPTASAMANLMNYATINGLDPEADFADLVTHRYVINAADVVYNNAIVGVDSTTGRPVRATISGAPSTSCMALVKPEAYATVPSGRYPIVSISYLLASSGGNGVDAANVRKLMWAPHDPVIWAATSKIGAGTGMAFLDLSAITQTQVNGCVVN